MFKRIVVAIDGSRTSQRAFEIALDLAVTHQAVVQPYYVVESGAVYFDVPGYDPSQLQKTLAEEGSDLARQAADALRQRGIEGQVVTVEATASDDIAMLITKAAVDFNADVLIMGTHGRKGFQRLLLGSVAERCLRQATLPVLLIPSAASPEGNESA
ncbi:universal stress protein [Caballeronia sp. LP006]|uniref:universal stress protein n=1 Tax=unclassified Caballeronia TaxID=2646786 RepID=UPI002028D7D8|nr:MULTISPECIES: universal stress protein [unclassified Caballeronia]MDR5828326.1 universal stress protein [Caballeronia sp. LP006]